MTNDGIDTALDAAVDAPVVEASTRRVTAVETSDRADIENLDVVPKRRVSIIDV